MKAGVKQMKKEYKKINIDKVEDLQVRQRNFLLTRKIAHVLNIANENLGRTGGYDV